MSLDYPLYWNDFKRLENRMEIGSYNSQCSHDRYNNFFLFRFPRDIWHQWPWETWHTPRIMLQVMIMNRTLTFCTMNWRNYNHNHSSSAIHFNLYNPVISDSCPCRSCWQNYVSKQVNKLPRHYFPVLSPFFIPENHSD